MKGLSLSPVLSRIRDEKLLSDTRQNYRLLLLLLTMAWILLHVSIRFYIERIQPEPWLILSVPVVMFALFILTFRAGAIPQHKFVRWLYLGFYILEAGMLYMIAVWDTNFVLLFGFATSILLTTVFFESRRAYFLYLGLILPSFFGILVYLYGSDWHEVLYPFGAIVLVCLAGMFYLRLKFQTQAQLREKEDLLNSVYMQSETALIITDIKGNILDLNLRASTLLGSAPHLLLGTNMYALVRESYSEQAFERILRNVLEKGTWHDKIEFCNVRGEIFWGEHTIRRIKIGRDYRCYFSISNITGHLMDRATIKESEVKYKLLMEEASDGIVLFDAQGKIISANAKAAHLLGRQADDLEGESFLALQDPTQQASQPLQLQELSGEGDQMLERKFLRADGTSITLELSLKSVHNDYFQAIFRDVTSRRASEDALVYNERRFRALIEHSHDVVIIVDSAYRITYLSPSFRRITQIVPSKVMDTSLIHLMDNGAQERLQKGLEAVMQQPGSQVQVKDLMMKNGDGMDVFFEAVLTNLVHEPVISGLVVNLHDVSVRKRTEHMLEQVNFELDSFIYKSSHDMRAPLMSILGLINLGRKATEKELDRYFDLMEKGIHRLDKFIRDLTHFSRNDRMKIERKPINFHALVHEIVGNLRFMQNLEKVRISVDVKTQQEFYSDPMRLSIILTNLISNAVKYHDLKKYNPFIKLEVWVRPTEVRVVVKDNGIGIEAPYLDKIFDMFYRASELSDGSGLGLYVAQSVAKKLNGTLTVQSEYRKGSTFTLVLPNMKPSRAAQLMEDDPEDEDPEVDGGRVIPLHHRALE